MAGVVAGLVIMIALSFFNYSVILKLYWLMYIGNLVLLGLVILMGEEGNGAQRWLKIGGLQFQPSELAKILLILFFAQFIMKYKEKLNTFPVIASIAVLMGVPWIMVKEQPALSTSLVHQHQQYDHYDTSLKTKLFTDNSEYEIGFRFRQEIAIL